MYNKVFIIGNLVRDPDLRYTPSGIPVARFSVAVNRVSKDQNQREVDFINVVAWRRLAEICGEFLRKGRSVAVEGRLQIRSFTGRDGQIRTMAEVVADNMQMLGRKSEQLVAEAGDIPAEAVELAESVPASEESLEEEAPF